MATCRSLRLRSRRCYLIRALAREMGARVDGNESEPRIQIWSFCKIVEEDSSRAMRILNVTQSYAPFFEFGGPPVKVRALSHELARRGHQVTVLTADWNLEARFASGVAPSGTTRSPFGWRQDEDGVQSIYLPTWLHYRALSWRSGSEALCASAIAEFRHRAHFRAIRLSWPGDRRRNAVP